MITINNIQKTYGSTTVLNIENLEIPKGQCFGLVGNNGAGKTTLFRLLLDLIKATKGQVSSKDSNVAESELWKDYTAAYLDENFLVPFLTPEEYFEFVAKLRGVSKEDLYLFINQFEDIFNDEILEKKKYIRDLSKGNQKKVGIVSALIGNPEIVILDEPFANLDPSTQIKLKNLLRKLSGDEAVTLIVSSHDLTHVTEVCERIVVLDRGVVIKDLETNTDTLKELEAHFTPVLEVETDDEISAEETDEIA